MFNPKFTITNKINNSLLEIERARGFLEAVKLKKKKCINGSKASPTSAFLKKKSLFMRVCGFVQSLYSMPCFHGFHNLEKEYLDFYKFQDEEALH